ncbi:aldose 1-epimerase family protein [Arthrobacter sp. H41]|uniref:aldose 1-epimerase family protein n=1 Tax=Arthrobacter sp. H41 TaxID=1312978 RepID=UPI00047D3484|nr:aldose 1-epimerase family protein [Arthrobacter sp. H41]
MGEGSVVVPLSGHRHDLRFGRYSASIASVGASLRSLTFDGRNLILPFDEGEIRPYFRGAVLAPWPNRVVDGRYDLAGTEQVLSITEPERNHALHGLVVWNDWQLVERGESAVRLRTQVVPQKVVPQRGYPFRLEVQVAYNLTAEGLHTRITAENTGPSPAPFGAASHPYLLGDGGGKVDEWTLSLPAGRYLEVTEDRLIPTGLNPVNGNFDFRSPRRVGTTFLDHAFTSLDYDDDGSVTVSVVGPGGRGAGMSFDTTCPWVQIHTADQPDESISRLGMAVEAMTCPPDAFNSGTDLIIIEPGEFFATGWTIHTV